MTARSRRGSVAAALLVALVVGAVPGAGAAEPPPHVFVYSGTSGFRHLSIPHAKDVLAEAAQASGAFTVEFSDDPAALDAAALARADVVLWLSTTGTQSPFSDAQEDAYVEWMRCGGGHAGVHASTDSWKGDATFPEWVEVTGAFFRGHPITATSAADDQFRDPEGVLVEGWGEPEATIVVAAPEHAATAPWRGRPTFEMRDEHYYYDRDPATVMADFEPLLTFGGFTDPVEDVLFGGNYPEDMPVAWTGSFRGRNRTFYTNLGHSIATWNLPAFVDHLVAGLLWSAAAPTPEGCSR
jgi:cytochrome c